MAGVVEVVAVALAAVPATTIEVVMEAEVEAAVGPAAAMVVVEVVAPVATTTTTEVVVEVEAVVVSPPPGAAAQCRRVSPGQD